MNEPGDNRGDLRSLMHEVKHAVIAQAWEGSPSEEKLEQIRAILRRTADEIAAL